MSLRSSGGFGSRTLELTSSSSWSAAATLPRKENPFVAGRAKAPASKATQKINQSTLKKSDADVEISRLREEAENAEDWAALHNAERFVHPRTGKELPEVVVFEPGQCVLLASGRATFQLRGLLHYLATGGSDQYVNAGDKDAQLDALTAKEERLRQLVENESEKALEMESLLLMQQLTDSRSTNEMITLVRAARDHLEACFQLEDQLRAEETLLVPSQSRIDEMRRAVQNMSFMVDSEAADAEDLSLLLRHQELLRRGLAAKRERIAEARVEITRLQRARFFLASRGFVQVASSGWQRRRHEDVLSATPQFSWSDYTWEADSSPAHPQELPAGAWFTVTLPAGLWIIPSHYALRHGDDGAPAAPAVRHDSNASTWAGTRHVTIAPADPPLTSWGSTTRARREFCGTALLDWQLWGREREPGGRGAGWVLLSDHRGDTALHAPFGEAVWRAEAADEAEKPAKERRKMAEFMVIMTGPTANGGHGMFCSGFEVFGQVGEEKERRPPDVAPYGLKYKFDNELYLVDALRIVPNECVVHGTNDALCPMAFASEPPLPPGMELDAKTGTISGSLRIEEMGEWQAHVLSGLRVTVVVTASNLVGAARTRVSFTMITAPRFFGYRHSEVTYEVGDGSMAFSREALAEAEARGWRRDPFLPIDLPREVESNEIADKCDLGSRFSWPANIPLPTVGGVPVKWTGRLSWPKFELAQALPQGLELDERTASISGVPTREERGAFAVRCVNPAGAATAEVAISVMTPPSGFEYEKPECVLVYMEDVGHKTCRCERGTLPLRFAAAKLPRGLEINARDGTISGVATQLDQSFERYVVQVANDVGLAETALKLLVAMPMERVSEADRIVNLNVEARVGQKVRGIPRFIAARAATGLLDPSATMPRHPGDALRFGVLEKRARSLGWRGDPRAMHVAAAGRGTITQVLLDGDACQVRWENTGLVSVYRTGKDGEYELMLWGTSRRAVEAWEVLPDAVREGLAGEETAELEAWVDHYLAEYRAGGRWQHREVTKLGLFDPELRSWLTGGPLPFGFKDRALLQRLVMELGASEVEGGDAGSGASYDPAARLSPELWNCLHIRDAKVGLAIDWDPYIGFMESVQHALAAQRPPLRSGSGPVPAVRGSERKRGKALRLKAKAAGTGKARAARVQVEDGGEEWELEAAERRCVMTWLLVDKRLRKALQDSVGDGWTAEAAVKMVRGETRRMGKQQFLTGAREMNSGLRLGLSDNAILLLFKQADADQDGYITLVDVVRAFKASRRLSRWQKHRRREANDIGGAGAACVQAGLNVTWADLVERVHSRPVSMTLHAAADIHDILDSKLYPALAPFERKGKTALSRVVQQPNAWATPRGEIGSMRQWAQFAASQPEGGEEVQGEDSHHEEVYDAEEVELLT